MKTAQRVQQIRKIIALDPIMEAILLTDVSLEEKRYKLRSHLSNLLLKIYDKTHDMPALEWVVFRDTIWVLRNMLNTRSEELAGFSLLAYLDNLLHGRHQGPPPSSGFIAELRHLVKGIKGLTHLYTEKRPAFLKHTGRTAAKMRSTALSQMARKAKAFIDRYPCGMDDELIRERSSNRQHLFQYFNITDLEWNDWTWHNRNIIRDPQVLGKLINLSIEEQQAVTLAREQRIPFGITPYTMSLMDRENRGKWDTAIRAQVIPPMQYVQRVSELRQDPTCSNDFMVEGDTSPIDGITRRYPNIVILKPVLTCPQICVYCQRNWQIQDVTSSDAALGEKKLTQALDWIDKTKEISEVLVTGGDPLILSDDRLEMILGRLAQMEHVVRIRIGTRTPVTLPQRITESLVRTITRFHEPGRREMVIITHFEHPTEITPEAMQAVQRFRLFGVEVYNQMVFTYYNSKKFEAATLRQQLRLIGVTPYYTFNAKGKEETDDYRVPIARLLQEQQEEARLFPGTVRTDEIVFNVPRLGKNYLRSGQNRDMIAILPDGRRVYEFHPWEKKMALMDTYVYTDVSIHAYLKRLQQDGEQTREYNSIWYYY
ncbi:KamA family radical SAM protein [Desulfogranum mediterraneum]|uniref:KamA family radical SAM protein n=1 Tax=Desulfogranum mediterraneum TaxID=160661 RepID=UPI0003FF1573|nr:KamA family radical SAM protein [Desulfogranum mediterraneum]